VGDDSHVEMHWLATTRDQEDAPVGGRVLVAKTIPLDEMAKAWMALNIPTTRTMLIWIHTLVGKASQAANAHTSRHHKTAIDRCTASTRTRIRHMHYNISVAKWLRLRSYTRLAAS
jgi:hypothetical protein